MTIRYMVFTLAVCLAVGCVTEGSSDEVGLLGGDPSADEPTLADPAPNFKCLNAATVQLVSCSGIVAIFPIKIDISNVDILSNNDLNVLNNALNQLAILNHLNVDVNNVLKKVELEVLNVFLNKFNVDIDLDDNNVCTVLVGGLLCK